MNRKEKIRLLQAIENGNFDALNIMYPCIIIIFKDESSYEKLDLSKNSQQITYTETEVNKLETIYKNRNDVFFKIIDVKQILLQ